MRYIRPKNLERHTVTDLSGLLVFLKDNPQYSGFLAHCIQQVLFGKKFNKFLSDAGILQDTDFIFELRKRFFSKILPQLPRKDKLDYVLNQIFFKASDIVWINRIPKPQLREWFGLLDFGNLYDTAEPLSPLSEVLISMELIIQRISGRAMETEVIQMVPEFDGLDSPFTAFEVELLQLADRMRNNPDHAVPSDDLSYKQLQIMLQQCSDFVEQAFANSAKFGISLRVNQNLLRIRQQIQRLQSLMPLLSANSQEQRIEHTLDLGLQLIKYNCYKNNIRKFISESTQLISYEITQHTAKTGEHYITETRREYFRMLRAALGGGLIVGILCIIKVLLAKVDASIFGHGFYYSMNYAFGFIAIYLLGFTLATKQPAMTASALVKALMEGRGKQGGDVEKYQAFAILFARVFRSQFIAFVGNVLMAFPVSLLGVWLIDLAFGANIADHKWFKLAIDLSPIHSQAVFHAAIAGVFLFLSGIISGSIANRDKYGHVYFRIQEHPVLKSTFGKQKTLKFAAWYEKRWAGLVSNFWFGVFMGSTAAIGLFLGLDLDIRHITFASGNLALAVYGSHFALPSILWFWGILGIGVIGLVNFLVSFGLSLGLAFRSRNISLYDLRFVVVAVWLHFKSRPSSFFFPTERAVKTPVEVNYLKHD